MECSQNRKKTQIDPRHSNSHINILAHRMKLIANKLIHSSIAKHPLCELNPKQVNTAEPNSILHSFDFVLGSTYLLLE